MRSYDWPEAVKLYELCEGANLVILSLSMFCKESPFVVVFTGVTVLSQCFRGFFSVDFIEARTERKKTIVKDENSIYWKGFWKKGTGPLYPCCSSIDQKLRSLDIEGEKYIDNLWEVVKYKKKKLDLPLLSGSWEIANCQPHNFFFINMQIDTKKWL